MATDVSRLARLSFPAAVALAVGYLALMSTDPQFGECSWETGYEPRSGWMGFLPWVFAVVGLVEFVAAFLPRNRAGRRVLLGGAGALWLGTVVALLALSTALMRQACD